MKKLTLIFFLHLCIYSNSTYATINDAKCLAAFNDGIKISQKLVFLNSVIVKDMQLLGESEPDVNVLELGAYSQSAVVSIWAFNVIGENYQYVDKKRVSKAEYFETTKPLIKTFINFLKLSINQYNTNLLLIKNPGLRDEVKNVRDLLNQIDEAYSSCV
jgi:hypothetical protein